MPSKALFRMICGFLLFGCCGVLIASEADKIQERVRGMRREASAIAEHGKKEAELGNKEQAERLKKESAKLLEAAEQLALESREHGEDGDRPNIDKAVQKLRERHQDLLAKEKKLREAKAPEKELSEVREQIGLASRELHTLPMHQAKGQELPTDLQAHAERLEVASRRIQHIKAAAENLKKAEVHDLAMDLMKKAESMEREVMEGMNRLAMETQKIRRREHGPEHALDVVEDLKKEVEHLRAEVKGLRQKLEKSLDHH